MSMRGNYSITMDRGAVVGLGCTSDGPPTPGISSTKSWPFSVGVCSKGTFIADGYNCNGKITKHMWENLDRGRKCRPNAVRPVNTTEINILPYRPTLLG